jgi:hypothetical protein
MTQEAGRPQLSAFQPNFRFQLLMRRHHQHLPLPSPAVRAVMTLNRSSINVALRFFVIPLLVSRGSPGTGKSMLVKRLPTILPFQISLLRRVHPSAVSADHSKLSHINTYGSLPEYKVGQEWIIRQSRSTLASHPPCRVEAGPRPS